MSAIDSKSNNNFHTLEIQETMSQDDLVSDLIFKICEKWP